MKKKMNTVVGLALSGVMLVGVTACSSSSANNGPAEQTAVTADASAYAAIVDVRTPEEFAAGHVPGAINISVESPSFDSEIAALDPGKGTYLIY